MSLPSLIDTERQLCVRFKTSDYYTKVSQTQAMTSKTLTEWRREAHQLWTLSLPSVLFSLSAPISMSVILTQEFLLSFLLLLPFPSLHICTMLTHHLHIQFSFHVWNCQPTTLKVPTSHCYFPSFLQETSQAVQLCEIQINTDPQV